MDSDSLKKPIAAILESDLSEEYKKQAIEALRLDAEMPEIANVAEYNHYKKQYETKLAKLDPDDFTIHSAMWLHALGCRLIEYEESVERG